MRNYLLGLMMVPFIASVAHASSFFTVPTVDVQLLGTMITGILAALALLWGARKAIKVINRS